MKKLLFTPTVRRSTCRKSSILLALAFLLEECNSLPVVAMAATTLPDYDRRKEVAPPPAPIGPERPAAIARLSEQIPSLRVEFDDLLSAPRAMYSRNGFLSVASGHDEISDLAVLSDSGTEAPTHDDAHLSVKRFLKENADLFGFGPESLATAVVRRDYVTDHNGLRTVIWEQELDGIPVSGTSLRAHITRRGELICVCGLFVPDLERAANAGTANRKELEARPPISAQDAVALAADEIGVSLQKDQVSWAGTSSDAVSVRQRFTAESLEGETLVRLVWLPFNDKLMRLS
jgi:hypothetical protein